MIFLIFGGRPGGGRGLSPPSPHRTPPFPFVSAFGLALDPAKISEISEIIEIVIGIVIGVIGVTLLLLLLLSIFPKTARPEGILTILSGL